MRYLLLIALSVILTASTLAFARGTGAKGLLGAAMTPQQIPSDWFMCNTDNDCTAGIMGCWQWVPINKQNVQPYIGAYGGQPIIGANQACPTYVSPGPLPRVSCVQGRCAITKG